jgi:hypothetical protein
MKKIFFYFIAISFAWIFSCCNHENNNAKNNSILSTDTTKTEVWAELVESKTPITKPEGFDDSYWNSISKKVNRSAIFNTITDAILSGKKKAYDILTDSVLTIDQVKTVMDNGNSTNPQLKKINENDLSAIRMREKWIFNKETFTIEKKVTRIDFLLKKLNETGDYIGDKTLFYVKMDN